MLAWLVVSHEKGEKTNCSNLSFVCRDSRIQFILLTDSRLHPLRIAPFLAER